MSRLVDWSGIVRRLLATEIPEEERQQRFVDEALLDLRRTVGDQESEQYNRSGRLDYSWQGLARDWRKVQGLPTRAS